MTTNQPDRLDRIEATLERVATQQEVNTAGIAELRNAIGTLVQVASLHQQENEARDQRFEMFIRNLEVMQSEIRGLQMENRRMLEELRNRGDDEQV